MISLIGSYNSYLSGFLFLSRFSLLTVTLSIFYHDIRKEESRQIAIFETEKEYQILRQK